MLNFIKKRTIENTLFMIYSYQKKGIVRFKLISEIVIICRIVTFYREEMLEVVIEFDVFAGINEKCC